MKKFIISLLVVVTVILSGCGPVMIKPENSDNVTVSELSEDKQDNSTIESSVDSIITESGELSAEKEFSVDSSGDRMGLSAVVSAIQESVVAINVTGTASFYYFNYPTEGSGSGVIISEDGYIVTNNHVINGGNNITVFLNDNTSHSATVIGTDPITDIAVLKIEAENLKAARFGDSSTLRVGDFALAIGNPLGEYQGSVTFGIVSALNREIKIDNEVHTMFQVDAAINPGNSGGGMFDSNGTLIGIVTAKNISEEVEGLGFVLPMNDVKPVIEDLINHGYVTGRPTLGFEPIEISSMRDALRNGLDKLGVYVNKVEKGSCAEQCGLRFKDYIYTADGETIATIERLEEILDTKKVGETMVLEVWRDGDVLDVVLVIGEEKS